MSLLIALLAAAASTAGPASATTAVVWSTYLRSGPGAAYAVLDEVEHDTPVTRLACASGWCRIRTASAEGYVDQTALDLPSPRARGGPDCLRVRLADDTGPPFTRLCVGSPAPPPPAPGR